MFDTFYQELPIASQSDVCTSQLAAVANMPHLQLQPHNRPHRCARHCQPQTFRTSIGGSSSNVSRLRSPQHRQQLSKGLTCVGAAEGEPSDEAGFGFDRAAMGTVYLQQQADVSDSVSFPCTLPLLPFPIEEVLLPGSVKSLHLFEARYLSLLDSVLAQPSSNKLFGHVVVEQQGDAFGEAAATFPGAYKGDGFVFLLATVVRVVEVKKTFVGALVRIQAEGRAEIRDLVQMAPYFVGQVAPLSDQPMQDMQQIHSQVEQLSQTMRDLQNLTQRFKSKQTASLQQAMYWADRDALIPAAAAAAQAAEDASISISIPKLAADDLPADASIQSSTSAADSSEVDTASAAAAAKTVVGEAESLNVQDAASSTPPAQQQQQQQQQNMQGLAEEAVRLSFAALQGVPEENPKDQLKLLRCCVKAMKTNNTSDRLEVVQGHMQNSLNTLAAKCALKALNLG